MTTREKREQLQSKRRNKDKYCYDYLTDKLEKTITGKSLHSIFEKLEDQVVNFEKIDRIKSNHYNYLCSETKGSSSFCNLLEFERACEYLVKYEYNITKYTDEDHIYWGAGEQLYTKDEVVEIIRKQTEEENERLLKKKEEYERAEKNKPWYKKEIKYQTAPTLKEGFCVYILCMLFCSIFYERLYGWCMCTLIFIWWRKKEINKYNKK